MRAPRVQGKTSRGRSVGVGAELRPHDPAFFNARKLARPHRKPFQARKDGYRTGKSKGRVGKTIPRRPDIREAIGLGLPLPELGKQKGAADIAELFERLAERAVANVPA